MYLLIHSTAKGWPRAVLLAFLLWGAPSPGDAGELSDFDGARTLRLMQGPDAKSRTLAYRACRSLGEAGKPIYRELLEKAAGFHQRKIEESIDLARDEANRFSGTLSKLQQQRNFALEFTLSDVADDARLMADLARAHSDARLWFREAQAQHGRATASMGVISDSASAIDEIRREASYCAGKAAGISTRTFNQVLSKHSTYASNLHDRIAEMALFLKAAKRYEKATAHNHAQTWATTEMRAFADILNERRHTLGLSLLRLERRLSDACSGHAREMVELNYFAHRSPVAANSTPGKRAAKAEYQGIFVGENIFFYASPRDARAAFEAWWRSDGHRFVMFDPKSDELGVSARPATHWTMMTGVGPVATPLRRAGAE